MNKIKIVYWILTTVLGLWMAQSCTKVVNVAPLRVPDNSGDTTHNVRKILDSVPGFSLFAYACNKAGITSGLQANAFYTLFVPTDSAMQAAGLTQSGIDGLSPDSLTKIVQYHITYGALADTVLNNALVSVQQFCLLETTLFSPAGVGVRYPGYHTYQHSLYVKTYNGVLNVNGWVVSAGGAAIPASNGYLYSLNQVLIPPSMKVSDVVFTRPEFSFYATAIETIDSIYNSIPNTDQSIEDTILFSNLKTEEGVPTFGYYPPIVRYPTVFAPTNTAFINAGLGSEGAVKQWIVSTVRIDTVAYYPQYDYYVTNPIPGEGNNGYNFVTIDSIMKAHYMLPATEANGSAFAAMLCYNDLTMCPSVNSGILNESSLSTNSISLKTIAPFNLKYHADGNGVLNIQWNAAGTNNALIQLDKNQGVQQRSFWTMNGVVYATDQLFYQP